MVSPGVDLTQSVPSAAFISKVLPVSPTNAAGRILAVGSERQHCGLTRSRSPTRPISPVRQVTSAWAAGSVESLRTAPSAGFPLGVRAARAIAPAVYGSFSPPALRTPQAIPVPLVPSKETVGVQPVG